MGPLRGTCSKWHGNRHPSRSTRRQTTHRQTSLPLAPLSEHQETDYTQTDKPSPGTPLGAPARRQTTQRQTSLPLAPLSEHQETGYTKTDKPSPGTPLRAPGDRLHTDRQAFPWHPSQSTRRQATHRQTSLPLAPLSKHQETDYTQRQTTLPLAPLSEHQETDYTQTDKPSPGTPLEAPGDRLHKDRQAFPWHPSRSTRRQTTQRQTSLPLAPLSEHQETDYIRANRQAFPCMAPLSKHQETDYTKIDKPSPGTPLGAPGDRLHKDRQAFP